MSQSDSNELEFEIPRNLKAGQSFYGLDVKGWICLLSTSLLLGGSTIGIGYLISKPFSGFPLVITLGIAGMFVGISYMSFEMDEKTGEMKIMFLLERLGWLFSEKVVDPKWSDGEYGKIVYEEEK